MVRFAAVSSALLIAASALSFSDARLLQYKIRVTNWTYQQPFSPLIMMAHTEVVRGFQVGREVEDQFKILAETGDFSALLALADHEDVAKYLCGIAYGSESLPAGETQQFTLTVDKDRCPNDVLFSMAGMLVNTNDAFVGIDSLVMDKRAGMTVYPPAYDAGTEDNNELCSHIPGPACNSTSGNEEAGPGEGFVHVHPGFHGVGDELSAAGYDWRNPVAEVSIGKPTRVKS